MAWLMGEPLIKTPAQVEAERLVKALETAEKTSVAGEAHRQLEESVAYDG